MTRPRRAVPAVIRPLDQWNSLYLGIIGVAVVIVLIVTIAAVSSLDLGKQTIDAEFAQAAGIEDGDQVTLAGVSVGEVTGTRLDTDRVVVTMKIDRDLHLGPDTRVAIKLTTLLGSRYVSIMPAGVGELDSSRLPLDNSEVPYDLQALLQEATGTFEQVDGEQVADAVSTLAQQLEGTPQVVPQALANVQSLTAVIASRRTQIGELLAGTSQLTTVIRNQEKNIGSLMRQGRDLMNDLDQRSTAIESLFTATTTLIAELHRVVAVDRPQIQSLIDNLNSMLGSMAGRDDLFRNILQILPVPIRNFVNATGTANDVDFIGPAGVMVDSWMCALSGRAEQLARSPYFEDCR